MSDNELRRWEGFVNPNRQREFLLGRAAAKQALLGLARAGQAADWSIQPGVWGQPVVYGPLAGYGVSISHHGRGAALRVVATAFDLAAPLSVDAERLREKSLPAIRARLTPSELALLNAIDLPEGLALTLAWTAKEAVAKQLQTGFLASVDCLELGAVSSPEAGRWQCRFARLSGFSADVWVTGQRALAFCHPREFELRFDRTPCLAESAVSA